VLATLLNLILLYQWYHSRTAKITLLDDFQMLWVVFFLTHLLPLCPRGSSVPKTILIEEIFCTTESRSSLPGCPSRALPIQIHAQ
jgi:hypothetical protein